MFQTVEDILTRSLITPMARLGVTSFAGRASLPDHPGSRPRPLLHFSLRFFAPRGVDKNGGQKEKQEADEEWHGIIKIKETQPARTLLVNTKNWRIKNEAGWERVNTTDTGTGKQKGKT